MATTSGAILREADRVHTLSVIRMLVAGGLTASALFLLCWVAASLPYGAATHAYIGLFTSADYTSPEALAEGISWSLLFGGLAGAIFALIYNVTAYFGRR